MAPALGLELEPGVAQRLCKVVVYRTCDGHRVGQGLCFFVVFAQAAAKVFLDYGVARRVLYGDERRRKQTEHTLNVRMKKGIFILSVRTETGLPLVFWSVGGLGEQPFM